MFMFLLISAIFSCNGKLSTEKEGGGNEAIRQGKKNRGGGIERKPCSAGVYSSSTRAFWVTLVRVACFVPGTGGGVVSQHASKHRFNRYPVGDSAL